MLDDGVKGVIIQRDRETDTIVQTMPRNLAILREDRYLFEPNRTEADIDGKMPDLAVKLITERLQRFVRGWQFSPITRPRHTNHHPASFGNGSLGFTPYFFRLARPQGHPPKVITVSMAWRNRARRLPFLALVQTGQRCSQ